MCLSLPLHITVECPGRQDQDIIMLRAPPLSRALNAWLRLTRHPKRLVGLSLKQSLRIITVPEKAHAFVHRRVWLCWCVLEGHVSACLRGRARGGNILLLSKPILPHLESYSPAVTAPMIILVITKLLCTTWKFNFLVESYRELSLFRAKNPWTSQKKKRKYQKQPLASRFSWKIKKAAAHFFNASFRNSSRSFFSLYLPYSRVGGKIQATLEKCLIHSNLFHDCDFFSPLFKEV